ATGYSVYCCSEVAAIVTAYFVKNEKHAVPIRARHLQGVCGLIKRVQHCWPGTDDTCGTPYGGRDKNECSFSRRSAPPEMDTERLGEHQHQQGARECVAQPKDKERVAFSPGGDF